MTGIGRPICEPEIWLHAPKYYMQCAQTRRLNTTSPSLLQGQAGEKTGL
ncbi:Hypothetical protein BME20236_I0040 [Brucella melitensis]|nr:hypothetical protein DK61_1338 [Brucella melitensis bv. 2 str. 63/9]ALM33500.1 Hypothetical protein BME20236_I0040 [Brucella melitensis]ENQ64447.1 hypothetical protein C045_00029 [Brucella melitensis 64/150]ENQ67404.1 hypothetical protein C089_00029 [Brucella melitensis 66/59]ENQ69937.1 hypothetical protein C962_01728 [Brucella melitensis CNGB 1076]ENQ73028.1 hypothetical protein C963_01533 [Brucella melitensis CNGB 1120]ENQ76824.1 hypothetical protein C964_00087 [Brucella melitensis CNGB 